MFRFLESMDWPGYSSYRYVCICDETDWIR